MDTPNTTPEKSSGFKKVLFFLKLAEIRLRFVAILVIVALGIGYMDTIKNYIERWTRRAPEKGAVAVSDFEFYCAMHPFVVRSTFGKCPICGMDLIKRKRGEATKLPQGVLSRVQVSPERIMQAGVKIEPVAYRLLSHTIQSYGIVETDETRVARINARFPGRVEELVVNATGVEVKKGDPLVRIYTPKYLAASYQHLQALETAKKLAADPAATEEQKQSAMEMAKITRKPLELQGFTKEQLDEMDRSGKASDRQTFYSPVAGTVLEKNVVVGDNVDESMTMYTVADLSTVWVQAQVIESDIGAVKKGMPVEILRVSDSTWFYGNVDLIFPTVNTENRSVKVRIAVLNPKGALKPGMYVTATIRAPLGQSGEVGSPNEPKIDAQSAATLSAKDDGAPIKVDVCPVSGDKLGTMGDPIQVEVEGRKVTLCCSGCVDKIKANSKKFLATLDEAIDKASRARNAGASDQRWAEGYTCEMHPDELASAPGDCKLCDCGMKLTKWRVERILSIPETAVVDTGKRQIVYVESAPGVYDARAVTLSSRAGNFFPVIRGLSLGQRVVAKGSFLIDAEARLNPTSSEELSAEPMPEKEPAKTSDTSADNSKDAGPFKVKLELNPAAPKAGHSMFNVFVTKDGKPVTDATVSITLNMAMEGMKPEVIQMKESGGKYEGHGGFSMAGEWEVKISVKSPSGEGSASFKTKVAQ